MINIDSYIVEKLHINNDTKLVKDRTTDDVRTDSINFVKNWLNDNTDYKEEGEDYEISIKNDFLFLIIYSPDKKELEDIGEKLTKELKKEYLMSTYDYYELGSCNKTASYKKLIFNLNIEHIISRDDFNKTTFKRTKRF